MGSPEAVWISRFNLQDDIDPQQLWSLATNMHFAGKNQIERPLALFCYVDLVDLGKTMA